MELLNQFSEKYRAKIHTPHGNRPDRWGIFHGDEYVIPGKFGEIAEGTYLEAMLENGNTNDRFATLEIRLTAVPRNANVDKALNGRAKQAEESGMKLYQKNGCETVWGFDPQNDAQCRTAIKLIVPRMKRQIEVTPELLARLAAYRFNQPAAGSTLAGNCTVPAA